MFQLTETTADNAALILSRRLELFARARAIASATPTDAGQRIRIHGDYHLGQVLRSRSDYVILDFEGEPARSLAARRAKQSPLKDVAGMLRSFSYAAYAALNTFAQRRPDDAKNLEPWATLWQNSVSTEFLRAYQLTINAADPSLIPQPHQAQLCLLTAYLLEKSLYELLYELDNRPTWVRIPPRRNPLPPPLALAFFLSFRTLSVVERGRNLLFSHGSHHLQPSFRPKRSEAEESASVFVVEVAIVFALAPACFCHSAAKRRNLRLALTANTPRGVTASRKHASNHPSPPIRMISQRMPASIHHPSNPCATNSPHPPPPCQKSPSGSQPITATSNASHNTYLGSYSSESLQSRRAASKNLPSTSQAALHSTASPSPSKTAST